MSFRSLHLFKDVKRCPNFKDEPTIFLMKPNASCELKHFIWEFVHAIHTFSDTGCARSPEQNLMISQVKETVSDGFSTIRSKTWRSGTLKLDSAAQAQGRMVKKSSGMDGQRETWLMLLRSSCTKTRCQLSSWWYTTPKSQLHLFISCYSYDIGFSHVMQSALHAHPASHFLVALVHMSSLPAANGKSSVLYFSDKKKKNDWCFCQFLPYKVSMDMWT